MIVSLVNSRSHPRQATRYPSSWNALSPQWTCQCPLLLLCFQQLPTIKWNYPARMVHPGRSAGSLCLFEADTTKPFVPFCFQQLLTIKFCSPFVLITIQLRGWGQGSSPFCLRSSLQICTFVFNHFQDAPPATPFLSSFCIVAGGEYTPAAKRLQTMHQHKVRAQGEVRRSKRTGGSLQGRFFSLVPYFI